jgi:hypothetical protein
MMLSKSFWHVLLGFSLGLMVGFWRSPLCKTPSVPSMMSTIVAKTPTDAASPAKFTIDSGNIAQFYSEFYRYYELNKEW